MVGCERKKLITELSGLSMRVSRNLVYCSPMYKEQDNTTSWLDRRVVLHHSSCCLARRDTMTK